MAAAVVRLKETRAMLKALGPPPLPQDIEQAQTALRVIDEHLASQLLQLAPQNDHWKTEDLSQLISVRNHDSHGKGEKEIQLRKAAEEDRLPYLSVLRRNELVQLYQGMLQSADMESRGEVAGINYPRSPMRPLYVKDEVTPEVAQLLQEAYENHLQNLSLKNRQLAKLPNSFGKISSLIVLNLSTNQLQGLPDSISLLTKLVTLDVSSNHLEFLPESIGELRNLKDLNCSGNMLKYLPESINRSVALVKLNVSFNRLEYLPANFGSNLVNLERISLQLNNLGALPPSIGNMRSLQHLEVQFNKLKSLPATIGNLTNLETLDASSNFTSLVSLPSSIGDMESLTTLDLSYNQLRELPISMGKLQNLRKLKLDGNPLALPPAEVIEHSHEAVMEYLAEKWRASLLPDDHQTSSSNSKAGNYWSMPPTPVPPRHRSRGHLGLGMRGWFHGMCGSTAFFYRGSKSKLVDWQDNEEYL